MDLRLLSLIRRVHIREEELMKLRFDWPAADELLLYVIHGTLHLVGYDDTTPEAQAEFSYFKSLGGGKPVLIC